MPILVKFNDPANLTDKEVYYPEVGQTLGEFFKSTFTHNFGGLDVDLYLNGEVILSTATDNVDALNKGLDRVIQADDKFAIISRPAEPITIAYAIIAVLAIAAVILLTPDVPGAAESAGTSPNSQLNAATNEFRPGQGIPEVFGSPVSYPDFIQPSHYFYEDNLKIQRELFCFGVGSYDITAVRSGETLIEDIPSSSYTIYDTLVDGIPPQDQRVTVRETNEVTNQTLPAIDDSSVSGGHTTSDPDALVSTAGDTTARIGSDIITNLGIEVGDFINIKVTEQSGTNTPTTVMNGTWQVTVKTSTSVTLPTGLNVNTTVGYTTSFTVERASSDGEVENYIGWFGVSGDKNSEVWFHFVMPSGIRSDSGKELSVTLRAQIREVDEYGVEVVGGYTETKSVTITGNTLDAQYRTLKFTGLPESRYQGRARNSSEEDGGSASEKAVFEQMVGVEYQETPNYGDVTLLWVERKASDRIVSGAESKVNADLTRKLPYYNRTTGLLELDNLVATRDFADAAAYTLIVSGKRNEANVDLEELYTINDALDSDLRSFDFTFDDADVGLRERITVICNVARVLAYQNYQKWTFNRIESKAAHSMLFNRRNTIGEATQSFPQWLPSNKDSISLTYVTQPDNVEETIYRRISNGTIESEEGSYPEEITLVGCQSLAQATNRIEYEIRRLLYQRSTVEFQTHYYGLTSRIGDRVRWADINDHDVFAGEILDIFGDEYLTSEPIEFEDGKTYYVQTTNQDGEIGALVTCEALSYTSKGFKSSALSGAYTAGDGDFEVGAKYVIAPDDELGGTDYTLKSVANDGDGLVTITLSEYNDLIFEAD